MSRDGAYLVAHPSNASDNREENEKWEKIECAHCGGDIEGGTSGDNGGRWGTEANWYLQSREGERKGDREK